MAKDTQTADGGQAESAALKRLRAARRKPTQIGTAVDCMREARATLDREYDVVAEETGGLAFIRELLERGETLARAGFWF